MKEYEAKTLPLLKIYEKNGNLLSFEAKKGKKDYPRLKEMIDKHFAKH